MAAPSTVSEPTARHLYTTLAPPNTSQQHTSYPITPHQDTIHVPLQYAPQPHVQPQQFTHQSHLSQQLLQQQSVSQSHTPRQSVYQTPTPPPAQYKETLPSAPQANVPPANIPSPAGLGPAPNGPSVAITAANSGIPVYNYKFHDAGNNQLTCDNPNLPSFSIQTTRGFMDMPKQTRVVCTWQGEKVGASVATVQGQVDWKNKRVVVGNVSKTFAEAKKKIGGTLSLDAEWTWPSGKYTITRKSTIWVAMRGGLELATYTSLKVNAFSKNELATLRFHMNMPDEERIFLIIALMYHDFQMPPVAEPKTFKQAAGEAGVHVATTVATNALTACCVVQ